jgi:hypothetical protein
VAVLAGCAGFRHHSPRNAPGIIDVDTPAPGERGDPKAYVWATDPGENQLGIMPAFWFMPGAGRVENTNDATLELGAQVTFAFGERDSTGSKGAIGFPLDSWGATIGWAFVQIMPDTVDDTTIRGPVSIEATRVWYLVAASAGVCFYPTPGNMDVGGQITLSAAIFALRMRYVQDSGFEIFGGYEVPLPASITWSR